MLTIEKLNEFTKSDFFVQAVEDGIKKDFKELAEHLINLHDYSTCVVLAKRGAGVWKDRRLSPLRGLDSFAFDVVKTAMSAKIKDRDIVTVWDEYGVEFAPGSVGLPTRWDTYESIWSGIIKSDFEVNNISKTKDEVRVTVTLRKSESIIDCVVYDTIALEKTAFASRLIRTFIDIAVNEYTKEIFS